MSNEQLSAFMSSLNEREAVEWDLLLTGGIEPARARDLILGARPVDPAEVNQAVRVLLKKAETNIEEAASHLAWIFGG